MSPVVSNPENQASLFAAVTFFARCHPVETCGSNGLPLTPYSIAILGRAQKLKTIKHNNLCQYLDVIRGKHERTIVVAQYSGMPLSEYCATDMTNFTLESVINIAKELTSAISYLHNLGIIHRNLSPDNILIDDGHIKLFNYGLYYMTLNGKYVSFPVGYPKYLSPETLLSGPKGDCLGPKTDVWSLGLLVLELSLRCQIWPGFKLAQVMRKVLSLLPSKNVPEKIAREHNCYERYQSLDGDLRAFLESCLTINTRDRPTADRLLEMDVFRNNDSNNLIIASNDKLSTRTRGGDQHNQHQLLRCDLAQLYSWWQLAGGEAGSELKRQGLLKNRPPILSLPNLVMLNGVTYGVVKDQSSFYDPKVVRIPLANLMTRLRHVRPHCYWPLLHSPKYKHEIVNGSTELPLIIRERDTEYQFHRVVLFARLLKGYPMTRSMLLEQAAVDIPPLFRGAVWACLLGVTANPLRHEDTDEGEGGVEGGPSHYKSVDKETPTATDRQIEVDIPRCHQYNELLSSPAGHAKLKRLLKAWVLSNPQYVYWQGLDSLTAPFLYLNFTNESLAFASLSRFVPKYLHKFFLRDNSQVIKEYLGKFSQLTAYHEPELAVHLASINFIPELFAIPWFLTMFSHVFPIHKILHLWDKLLLGDSSFPLYIGLAILKQLKPVLMSSGFNECILLFSDLPEVDIESCLAYSMDMYTATPRSVLWRKHELGSDNGAAEADEFDVSGVEISDLQKEFCPRISAKDFVDLLTNKPDRLLAVDIRSSIQYSRACVTGSVNIPFSSVQLGVKDLTAAGLGPGGACLLTASPPPPNAAAPATLNNATTAAHRNVVVIGTEKDNVLLFSKFLVECGVARVSHLHGGFNILHSVTPNILHAAAAAAAAHTANTTLH